MRRRALGRLWGGLWLVLVAGAAVPAVAAPTSQQPSTASRPAQAKQGSASVAATSGSTPSAAPSGSAQSAREAAKTAPAPSLNAPTTAPADTEQRMDVGLERLADEDYDDAASSFYEVYTRLPENDLRRDVAAFHLSKALAELGFVQAAIEHYFDILTGRRSPELIPKALRLIQPLYEKGLVQEARFVDNLLFGSQFGEVPPESVDFVEYLQALGDLRHRFSDWGRARLEVLAKRDGSYAWRAKYLLAVERIALKQDDGAEKLLRQVLAGGSASAPADTLNQSRLALARILYERKNYDEAWKFYSQIDLPLPLQDIVLLEKAWDRVARGDHQRALGMLVGLGAPVFRRVFAPERDLIRALALRRLCQYRAAHLAVADFRNRYGTVLARIRNHEALRDDPTLRQWAAWGAGLLESSRMRSTLVREKNALGGLSHKELRGHIDRIYAARIAQIDSALARGLSNALDHVADELLRIDEQMNLIDYEMGAGLFASAASGTERVDTSRASRGKPSSSQVYFEFDGEYWSDELSDFVVTTEDRCLR